MTSHAATQTDPCSRWRLPLSAVAWLLLVTVVLLFAAPLSEAACIPRDSPTQPNQDALAMVLKAQARCPLTTPDFLNLIEGAGAKLDTTMVNFRGFHNPDRGDFFLFQIVSGKLASVDVPVERGELLFGHFLEKDRSQLVLVDGGLLVEAIAWDPTKKLFNFYELTEDTQGPSWFYRGDSRLILDDIEFLHRGNAGQKPFKEQLRCSGCHVNGGLLQKELAEPHNDWFMKSHNKLGKLTPDAAVTKIFKGLIDADELTKVVRGASRRLAASPEYRKALQSRTMQEQLRPLFCAVEINLESDRPPFDEQKPTVQIPAGFFVDPRLGESSIAIPRENYEQALLQLKSHLLPKRPVPTDADHAWLTPVKADSDMVMTEVLVDMGIIDNEFVADVLAVDFTNPLFSASRCQLLREVPPEGGADFRMRFEANLKASPASAAKELLDNLTDPTRDAKFHRLQVAEYLDACQKRAPKREAAIEWFRLLVQRRAEVDQQELSMHAQGSILESPDRVVFPLASAPKGILGLTSACEIRAQ
jgi:hypothetical protein